MYKIIGLIIVVLCLPLTIPAVLIGVFCRLALAGYLFGYESTNDVLHIVFIRAFRRPQKAEAE